MFQKFEILYLGVEQSPNGTGQVIGGQIRLQVPDPIKCQDPDIKVKCLFHIHCAVFCISA